MNLSSSTAEKNESGGGIFDSSLVLSSIIFFLVVAGFGGVRWYIGTLDDKLANLDATLGQNSSKLQGDQINRVAYFDARLGFIEKQLSGNPVDSQKLLSQLESLAVPNVRLTKYEYNESERFVAIEGDTESFKYVAQQVISLKSDDLFREIRVNLLRWTKDGRVEFSLRAQF